MDFTGKVVLITGGVGGIGQALGRAFLERGAKVSLCDINEKTGHQLVKNLKKEFGKNNIMFSKCDVSNEENFEDSYKDCEKEFGPIDILCNNAGVINSDRRTSTSINYEGVVIGTDLAIKRMGKHNGGKGGIVVNTGSITGAATVPFAPLYAASKAAVIHYSRCVGDEFHYSYSGVSVLCICPNGVSTDLILAENSVQKGSYNTQSEKALEQMIAVMPKLMPKDVATAVIQLINDNRTGEAMVIEKDVEPYYVPPSIVMTL